MTSTAPAPVAPPALLARPAGGVPIDGLAPDRAEVFSVPDAAPPSRADSAQPQTPRGHGGPTAAHSPPVADQIVAVVRQARPGTIEVTLEPRELGQLRLSLMPRDDGITLIVQADRPDTLDLVRRHGAELGRALQQAGYGSVDLSFGGGQARTAPGQPDPSASADADPAQAEAAAPTPQAPPPQTAAIGGLDIRL